MYYKGGGKDPERDMKTRQIIDAYKLLMDYCNDFPVDFSSIAAAGQIPLEEFWNKKFGNDPMWSKGDADGKF